MSRRHGVDGGAPEHAPGRTPGEAFAQAQAQSLGQSLGRLEFTTRGRGFLDITAELGCFLAGRRAIDGLLTVFLRHTSASLTIQENADPDVLADLGTALDRLAPENAGWRHTMEGPDDMPAHIKAALTGVSLAIPVMDGRLELGTWQGVYLVEHRSRPHLRGVTAHFLGTFRP
ncbi:MAG: secondary thiamine-phosphate synthase enzyme YjbQ [Hyphomicrobiales bacterium]